MSTVGVIASSILMCGCGQMRGAAGAIPLTAASSAENTNLSQALPSLPKGVVLVGDLGAVSATLVHVNPPVSQTLSVNQQSGLVINLIWDASVANAPAGFQSVVEKVAQFYESQFSNPITLNINVGWGEVEGSSLGTAIGESEVFLKLFDYSEILAALSQNAVSSAQLSAINALTSFTPSGSNYVTIAEAKAIGLITDMTAVDGYIGFNSSYQYSYDDSNGVPGRQYDLYGVVAHEMSEVMGRLSLLGYNQAYSGLDLFRYSAPGVPCTANNQNQSAYFSDDGGTTVLYYFNTSSTGDFGDLATSSSTNAYDAYGVTGEVDPVTTGDLTIMNVLGYNLSSPSPVPTPTATPSPVPTPTATPSPVPTPTATPSPGPTPTATPSPVPTPTATPSPVPTPTQTPLPPVPSLTVNQVDAIYEAVLQRAPTSTEVSSSLSLAASQGPPALISSLVDSTEATTHVYPVLQMFYLASGYFPSASTLASIVQSDLTSAQLSLAMVTSQNFANVYNSGNVVDPNSPVSASIVETLYTQGLGHTPTQTTLNGWLSNGWTVAQAFQEMAISQTYIQASQPAVEQYLTAAATKALSP